MVLWVGQTLYRNGAVFLRDVFEGEDRVNAVNRLLLVGFYLVNVGFVLLTSSIGTGATTVAEGAQNLTMKLGAVAMLLGVMHVVNLSALNHARQRRMLESRRLAAGRLPAAAMHSPYPPAPAGY
jgi:hypothetical protein